MNRDIMICGVGGQGTVLASRIIAASAMDEGNRRTLSSMCATVEQESKIVMMGNYIVKLRAHYDYVPDPYYEGAEGFELALDLLEDACGNLLNEILQNKQ